MAAGAVWFALGAAWAPLMWLGALWWAGLLAATALDAAALGRATRPPGGSRSPRGVGSAPGLVTVRRQVENIISLGAADPVTLVVRNRSGHRLRCVVRDEPPLDMLGDGEAASAARLRIVCELPAYGGCVRTYHVTPPRRGDFHFGAVNLRLTAGFGLVARQLRFEMGQSVKVYPSLAGIRAHEIAAKRERLVDIGVHPSRLKGTGLEFESLRAYVPGDELRRVDWKATARHAELIAREFDLERSQHIMLCCDLGRTMASNLGLMTKADHAVNAAALLAHVAAKAGDWVGLYAFAQGPIIFVPPRKHQFSALLDALYGLQPQAAETDYYRSFTYAARMIRKRSLVVLFTDLLDPDSSARLIRHASLLTGRHLVLCAALSDYELYEIASRAPAQPRDLYERTVATALLADRQRALSALRHHGAIALDATPANLAVEVLNHYLEIKARSRL